MLHDIRTTQRKARNRDGGSFDPVHKSPRKDTTVKCISSWSRASHALHGRYECGPMIEENGAHRKGKIHHRGAGLCFLHFENLTSVCHASACGPCRYVEARLGRPTHLLEERDKFQKFLENDRKVLKFFAQWMEDGMYGCLHNFVSRLLGFLLPGFPSFLGPCPCPCGISPCWATGWRSCVVQEVWTI